MLIVIAVLVVVAALVAPLPDDTKAPGLSSYGTAPGGARGLYETLDRLGYRVHRSLDPMRGELDTLAVWLVLAPDIQPTATEVHRLLEAVRAGAGLLVIPADGSRLADSLGMRQAPTVQLRGRGARAAVPQDSGIVFGRGLLSWVLRPLQSAADTVLSPPSRVRRFLTITTRRGGEPVILGIPLGRGRMVVAANAELFSNFVVREGDPAVRVVGLVDWLLDGNGTRRTLVFDEYHHGFGTHASAIRVARRALLHTPAGRLLLQLAAAALILLIAIAVRPIRPSPRIRIERRSPLEHVTALARAYREARASDRATRLLVRGVRRRHGGLQARFDDAEYLRTLARRHPAVATDVDSLLAGMEEGAEARAPGTITAAIRHIEQVISS